jgi:hypothetical protein
VKSASADPKLARARAQHKVRFKSLRKRDRLRPCLDLYDKTVEDLHHARDPEPLVTAMSYITRIFRETFAEVLGQIEASGKVGISANNAVKRSAGTNFQGLCEYAIARWLENADLPVSICPNAPDALKQELTIFGADAGNEFSVEPDIDICLWEDGGSESSPLIFVSAKTSLVDRAGQAARWKLYLDLHQTTCPHVAQVHDCPVNRTRVKIRTKHPIEHAIVTANIYKIDTTQPEGELNSGQCKNNTYMFRHKYTTRNDSKEFRPPGWHSFSEFPKLIMRVFQPVTTLTLPISK